MGTTAQQLLESLDADDLRQRQQQLTDELKAVKILLRAASNIDRRRVLESTGKQPATAGGTR